MFKIGNMSDQKFQEIVSKVLQNGLEHVFAIASGKEDLIKERMDSFLEKCGIPIATVENRTMLYSKIYGMNLELQDKNYAYRFDPQGEWILYYALCIAFEDCFYSMDGKEFMNFIMNKSDQAIEKYMADMEWGSTLTKEEVEFVNKRGQELYESLLAEKMPDPKDNYSKKEAERVAKLFRMRVMYFPIMATEIIDSVTIIDATEQIYKNVADGFIFMDSDVTWLLNDKKMLQAIKRSIKDMAKKENIRIRSFDQDVIRENTRVFTGSQKYAITSK